MQQVNFFDRKAALCLSLGSISVWEKLFVRYWVVNLTTYPIYPRFRPLVELGIYRLLWWYSTFGSRKQSSTFVCLKHLTSYVLPKLVLNKVICYGRLRFALTSLLLAYQPVFYVSLSIYRILYIYIYSICFILCVKAKMSFSWYIIFSYF